MDIEAYEAEHANEPECYYNVLGWYGCVSVKRYKPSYARLLLKRGAFRSMSVINVTFR